MKPLHRLASFPALAFILAAHSTAASAEPLCVAHRGNSSEHLENSLSALRSAVEIGTPVVEFDVRHTRDGQPILLHDFNLRRTARSRDGQRCRQLLGVRRLSWKHVSTECELNNGEPIPTLQEALDELSRSGVRIFLELKDKPAPATLELIDEYYRTQPELLRIISFKEKYLRFARERLPEPLLLGGAGLLHVSMTDRGADLGFHGVSVHRPANDFIRRVMSMGLEASAWTIDDPAEMLRLRDAGVDYITTNRPALCMETVQSAQLLR